MLCGHISLSPLDPIFLLPRCIHCHTSSRHPFLVLHLVLPKQCFAAHSTASGGGFTFTTIITPQVACQLLCFMVIKTSTLKNTGRIPVCFCSAWEDHSFMALSCSQVMTDGWVGVKNQDSDSRNCSSDSGVFTFLPSTQNCGLAAAPCTVSHLPRRCDCPSWSFWARHPAASCPYGTS